ncbi:hypothetical protein SOVF_134770 [Spinacia oleracea]|nr:hypothetical protein SOVF_134770 [Spinacia oleracea]
MTALQLVFKKCLAHCSLFPVLHEGGKVIKKHTAQLVLLAEDFDQPDSVNLLKALCAENNVNLQDVYDLK